MFDRIIMQSKILQKPLGMMHLTNSSREMTEANDNLYEEEENTDGRLSMRNKRNNRTYDYRRRKFSKDSDELSVSYFSVKHKANYDKYRLHRKG